MNGTATATAEQPVNVEEHARIVMALLREYAEKLAALNAEFVRVLDKDIRYALSQAAWLLDQSELMLRPLLTVLSRGSGLRENAPLESITRDELHLRMVETEVHLHHMERQSHQLWMKLTSSKLGDQVAKLRVAAGLPFDRGSPARRT